VICVNVKYNVNFYIHLHTFVQFKDGPTIDEVWSFVTSRNMRDLRLAPRCKWRVYRLFEQPIDLIEPIGCPETSVSNYRSKMRKFPKQGRFYKPLGRETSHKSTLNEKVKVRLPLNLAKKAQRGSRV
jgi:hypothetical protein